MLCCGVVAWWRGGAVGLFVSAFVHFCLLSLSVCLSLFVLRVSLVWWCGGVVVWWCGGVAVMLVVWSGSVNVS